MSGVQLGSSIAFGGLASELSGGSFLNGAINAGIAVGFNHLGGDGNGDEGDEPPVGTTREENGMSYRYQGEINGQPAAWILTGEAGIQTDYTIEGLLIPLTKPLGIVGGKVFERVGKGLNLAKVPFFKGLGNAISKYAPSLNKGRGFRIGISKANNLPGKQGTRMVFRATYGNKSNHFFNIDLGKWGR